VLVQVVVEYHPDEVDKFIEVADAIEEAFPRLVVDGVETEEQRSAFEVKTKEGRILFSSLSAGRLPESGELLELLQAAGVQR
jgi:selT/selW/selH-like putative selenoprotein